MALKKSSMTVATTNIPIQILLWTLASVVSVVKTAAAAATVTAAPAPPAAAAAAIIVTVYPQQL